MSSNGRSKLRSGSIHDLIRGVLDDRKNGAPRPARARIRKAYPRPANVPEVKFQELRGELRSLCDEEYEAFLAARPNARPFIGTFLEWYGEVEDDLVFAAVREQAILYHEITADEVVDREGDLTLPEYWPVFVEGHDRRRRSSLRETVEEFVSQTMLVNESWINMHALGDELIVRFEAAKTAFDGLARSDRFSQEGTRLLRQIAAIYDKIILLQAEFDRRGGDVHGEDARQLLDHPEAVAAEIAEIRRDIGAFLEKEAAERRSVRLAARPEPIAPTAPVCAEDGCSRTRAFFDEDGIGYCKRHGNDRGLRPHGKVT